MARWKIVKKQPTGLPYRPLLGIVATFERLRRSPCLRHLHDPMVGSTLASRHRKHELTMKWQRAQQEKSGWGLGMARVLYHLRNRGKLSEVIDLGGPKEEVAMAPTPFRESLQEDSINFGAPTVNELDR